MRNSLNAAVVLYNSITNFNSIHMGIDKRISRRHSISTYALEGRKGLSVYVKRCVQEGKGV